MLDPQELSLAQIKNLLENLANQEEFPPKLIEILKEDERVGTQKILLTYLHKRESYELKCKYLKELANFDRSFSLELIGIDEAGRGPLAGPVVAAAVRLDLNNISWAKGINDSKKLSRNERQKLYKIIKENALDIGIGIVDAPTIDEVNILVATHQAMKQATENLSQSDFLLLVDGLPVPLLGPSHVAVVQGDAKSLSIAAASIIAKETRDCIMEKLDQVCPGYGFAEHKGYGTKDHLKALETLGVSPVHRKSFLTKLTYKQGALF